MNETRYTVRCDDCDLHESYTNERIARGHKLSHWEDRQHVASVEEAEANGAGEQQESISK